jgi:sugar phosphate isomerase/epimerase
VFASLNPGHLGIHVSLREGLVLAERFGFGGYDAQLDQLQAEVAVHGVEAVRDLFIGHGLRLGAWNIPFLVYEVSDEAYDAGMKELRALLPIAEALGAWRAGMWYMSGHDERSYDENFEFHVRRFQPVARLLADHGIRLGIEYMGAESWWRQYRHPFIHTLAGSRELARAIGPNCGQLLDCWHWHCAGETIGDLAELSRGEVVHVHVDDAPEGLSLAELKLTERRLPGTTGLVDLDGFMRSLARLGYDGPVTAEPFDENLNAMADEAAAALAARTTRSAVARAVPPPWTSEADAPRSF